MQGFLKSLSWYTLSETTYPLLRQSYIYQIQNLELIIAVLNLVTLFLLNDWHEQENIWGENFKLENIWLFDSVDGS
jgi:hypothetical protein